MTNQTISQYVSGPYLDRHMLCVASNGEYVFWQPVDSKERKDPTRRSLTVFFHGGMYEIMFPHSEAPEIEYLSSLEFVPSM